MTLDILDTAFGVRFIDWEYAGRGDPYFDLATLVEDEKLLGATVIDMGGGATSLAVFSEGHLVHTAQVAVGGGQVTNDLEVGSTSGGVGNLLISGGSALLPHPPRSG